MALFRPNMKIGKMIDLTPAMMHEFGIRALLLDIDNTRTTHSNPVPAEGVQEWIDTIKKSGFAVVICSNNFHKRILPFSSSVGLDCVAMSFKPFPFGFNRAKKKLHEKPKAVVVVGDQIYTDVLGANLAGMQSILLEPRSEEKGFTIWLRRKMEIKIRKRLYGQKKQNRG